MNQISKKAHVALVSLTTLAALAQGDTTRLKMIAIGCVTIIATLTVLLQSFLDRNNHKGANANAKEESEKIRSEGV